ncbi:MAG: HyaD/HybD family hydrogenase maturation endopeptidase [Campylobacterales bacterium]|nr:HyaD/HybD family hydrogenase maturation endopeptidase [Campylobacterales bacterium]
MSVKNIVIGVGNVLFKDEGVGIYAAKYLQQNYDFDETTQIIDGGVLGFKLMTYFQEYENVIILDTVSIEDEAGSIFRLPADVLLGLGSYRKTAHEVEIVEMLEICSMLEKMANVVIIGIIPKDIESVENSMTNEVLAKFPDFIDATLNEIKSLGVNFSKKDDVSVEYIIDNFFKEQSFGNQIQAGICG